MTSSICHIVGLLLIYFMNLLHNESWICCVPDKWLKEIGVSISGYIQHNSLRDVPRFFQSFGFITEQIPELGTINSGVEDIIDLYFCWWIGVMEFLGQFIHFVDPFFIKSGAKSGAKPPDMFPTLTGWNSRTIPGKNQEIPGHYQYWRPLNPMVNTLKGKSCIHYYIFKTPKYTD